MVFPRGVWLAYVGIAALLGLQAFLPAGERTPQPPAAPSPIAADFVGTAPIELSRVSPGEAYALVFVRNDSSDEVEAEVQAVALDRLGNEMSGRSKTDLEPRAAIHVRVRLSPSHPFDPRRDDRLPARGFVMLRLQAKDKKDVPPTVKVREIIVPQVQPSFAERQLTLVSLGAAALVLVFGIAMSFRAKPNAALKGTPTWTPQSWSTNLAIGGALLTGVLAIGGLPAQGYYSTKASYTALSAFFAALVALAPTVYGLLRVGQVSDASALRLFAFAAAITVWATVGQLGTAALVCQELGIARVLSGTAAAAAAALFGGVAVLVWLYALRAVFAYSTQEGSPTPLPGGGAGPVPPPGAANEWPLL